ncbi:hypothetical protein [Salinactinospora qingdaonensis]|uniref:Uncharacterized protein n=1 Tax=Salinactinospora qingdaonensis TaxID=702744 RepID=A0ABP7EZQ0_9ACTN
MNGAEREHTRDYTTVIRNSGDGNTFIVGEGAMAYRGVGAPSSAELVESVERLWDVLPRLGLDEVDQADYVEALSHIEEETTRSAPRRGRLRRALGTVAELLRSRPMDTAQLGMTAAGTIAEFYGLSGLG